MRRIFSEVNSSLIRHINKKDGLVFEYNKDHEREELICFADNIVLAAKYMKMGWKKRRVLSKIVLIAPEIRLVDLFNPIEAKKNGGLLKHLVLYNVVKGLQTGGKLLRIIKRTTKSKFIVLKGKSIEFQVRIALFREESGLKNTILRRIIETKEYSEELRKLESIKDRDIDLSVGAIKNTSKYKDLKNLYEEVMSKKFILPDNIYGFASQLPKADYYLLVPHSGFRFLDDISKAFGYDKVLFYEKHFSQDGDFWLMKKNIKNKKVIILDITYSGSTLEWVAREVKKNGGKPIKVAVFPASTLAVKIADYSMFIDRIISNQGIKLNRNWEINLYKELMI